MPSRGDLGWSYFACHTQSDDVTRGADTRSNLTRVTALTTQISCFQLRRKKTARFVKHQKLDTFAAVTQLVYPAEIFVCTYSTSARVCSLNNFLCCWISCGEVGLDSGLSVQLNAKITQSRQQRLLLTYHSRSVRLIPPASRARGCDATLITTSKCLLHELRSEEYCQFSNVKTEVSFTQM